MNKTILLVDDDQRLRELLKDYLNEKDLTIFTCQDFEEAKEVLKFGEMPLDAPNIQFVADNIDEEENEDDDLFFDGDLNEFEEFNEY